MIKIKKFKLFGVLILISIGIFLFESTTVKSYFLGTQLTEEKNSFEILELRYQEDILLAQKEFSEIMSFNIEKVEYVDSTDDGTIFSFEDKEYLAVINWETIEYSGINQIFLNYNMLYKK